MSLESLLLLPMSSCKQFFYNEVLSLSQLLILRMYLSTPTFSAVILVRTRSGFFREFPKNTFFSLDRHFTHNNYTSRLLRMNETTLSCYNFTFYVSPFQILMMIRVQCQVRSALVDFLLWRRGPGQMVLRKKLLTLTGPVVMTVMMKRYLQTKFQFFSNFIHFFSPIYLG